MFHRLEKGPTHSPDMPPLDIRIRTRLCILTPTEHKHRFSLATPILGKITLRRKSIDRLPSLIAKLMLKASKEILGAAEELGRLAHVFEGEASLD